MTREKYFCPHNSLPHYHFLKDELKQESEIAYYKGFIGKFCKNMQNFHNSVRHFEYLMSFGFFQRLYSKYANQNIFIF